MTPKIKYGPIVAKRYKKQYFKNKKWMAFEKWQIQPKDFYTVLMELDSKKAIEALLDESWTRNLPKQKENKK